MRPMRRAEREVTEEAHIREILEGCETLRLGLWDGEEVYVVPVSYGYLYEEGRCTLYFHGSAQGRKAEVLARGGNVGFELDRGAELVTAEVACGHSTRYQSVVGSGEAQRLVTRRRSAWPCGRSCGTTRARKPGTSLTPPWKRPPSGPSVPTGLPPRNGDKRNIGAAHRGGPFLFAVKIAAPCFPVALGAGICYNK